MLLSCEPASKVRVSVYASSELGPMLCHGELLCTFEISVRELLDRSQKSHPVIFQPKQGEVVSPCTSMFMTLKQRLSDQNNTAILRPLTTVTSDSICALTLETDAGHRLLAQYRRTQNSRDLDQSINRFEHTLDICPMDHPCRPAALFNLVNAKLVSCQANETYLDLDIPINLFQDALYLRPTGHLDRPNTQLHLAIALLSRFTKWGFQTDADAAEELLGEVLDVCHADSHIHRAALLAIETSAQQLSGSTAANSLGQKQPAASMLHLLSNQLVDRANRWQLPSNLGTMLRIRFTRRGNGEDLDQAITLLTKALAWSPVCHVHRSSLLDSLAVSLSARFDCQGKDEDLNQAIALSREALVLCPVGHTGRSEALNHLSIHLFSRFRHRGHVEDLDEAIILQKEALALRPVGHKDRYIPLNNLAAQFSSRFEHQGNDKDLDEAIVLYREALALCPVDYKGRFIPLNNLAIRLSSRFHHRGNGDDLDEAIALQREILALRPVGHPDRYMSLNNLAIPLSIRFKHRGNEEDLDQAIVLHREALALYPVGHSDRGNRDDLDEAIVFQREALALRPVDHPNRYKLLGNLAKHLLVRFDHEDLDEGIALCREVLTLLPVGHTHRFQSLADLAAQLSTRFEHRGNEEDLDETIALCREALALCPAGHTAQPSLLGHLAGQLSKRFDHRRCNHEDLDEAIALQKEALALFPVDHTHRSQSLSNLAEHLSKRFVHQGNDEDLDEAVALARGALALHPVGHIARPSSLNNFAKQLSQRFKHRGNDQDLDEAITLCREVLALRPVGHADRPLALYRLAIHLSTRFDHHGNGEDLDKSRENLRCALTLMTQHDPRRLWVHQLLATVYVSSYRHDSTGLGEDIDNLNAAMHHFKAATNIVPGGLLLRLQASLRWVHHAIQYSHSTQLDAHATSIQLLDAYTSVTASVSSRRDAMKEFRRSLAMDAASCALRSGDVCRAVELLEQGRTVIWTQMTRLRTPFDSLQIRDDSTMALMKRIKDLSSLLDKPPASHPEDTPRVDIKAEEARYRRLMKDWNGAVEEIRKIEGFSRFLLPPLFSDLQDAARDGPIIVLVASKSSCDDIIIPHKQPPISIQLPTDFEKLLRLMLALREAIEKEAGPKGNQPALIKALRKLWDLVVRPVVENLGKFARRGSRIWWCPTSVFNFLPLHAAGEYRANGESLSQQYISSYTPSLTALMRARRSLERSPSVSFAAIGQDHPAGDSFTLDCVEPELELMRSLLPPPPTVSFTKITSVDATKSTALCALQNNTWLHFACHGTQKWDEPFNSALLMRDKPLSLLDIVHMDLSRHQFAFLSACETAFGDYGTPDEVIHLAAGLQFAGIKSVIGTLWKVNDSTVQRLVEAFYKNLCGDGTMNPKRAARALHRAVQSLASDRDIPLDQRIVCGYVAKDSKFNISDFETVYFHDMWPLLRCTALCEGKAQHYTFGSNAESYHNGRTQSRWT
ncbi:CHAT domain-containing protein [Suillus bovinus]|uniref:CHAT domain-containing protein n=1 Tax=Suillus bovinus TaxID=48563 RepID=UPI001B866BA4|nr:CHAT domain-containing protein [Suillus bovinus]KAG2144699.1 CHAT domain-containing protein [Suillus bovinus]